jgi:hypothetical protein
MSIAGQKNPKLIPDNDIYLEIGKGAVPGHSQVIIRGHGTALSTAGSTVFSDLSEFGDITYMSSAEIMEIQSSSTADSSSDTGLQTILLQGIDNDGAAASEVVEMKGTTTANTVGAYKRVNALIGLAVGSGGNNAGVITAISATANTTQCMMGAREGISQNSHYTVPAEHTGYLTRVELNAAKLSGGGTPLVEIQGLFRVSTGNSWLQGFDKRMDTTVTDELDLDLPVPTAMQAGTDIRMTGRSNVANTEARSRMYIILVDDRPYN